MSGCHFQDRGVNDVVWIFYFSLSLFDGVKSIAL
jgi:hypothetical protein